MNIDHVEEFQVLALTGSFTRAAKKLFISQPCLSRHISALEQEIGQKLIFRESESKLDSLTLTKSGVIFLEWANEILPAYQSVLQKIKSAAKEKPELIRIQDLLHLKSMYVGIREAISKTQEVFPNVTFSFERNNNYWKDALQQNQIDIAFTFFITENNFEEPKASKEFENFVVRDYHGALGLGVKRNLLTKQKRYRLCDMAQKKFLLLGMPYVNDFRDSFFEICSNNGFQPIIDYIKTNNQLEFYSADPGNSLFLLTHLGEKGRTIFDDEIRENLAFLSHLQPDYTDYYVHANLIVRKEERSPAFNYFLSIFNTIENDRFENSKTP